MMGLSHTGQASLGETGPLTARPGLSQQGGPLTDRHASHKEAGSGLSLKQSLG